MIHERTPGEKTAYVDGFKEAIKWFETLGADPALLEKARALHALMLATLPESEEEKRVDEKYNEGAYDWDPI